MITLVGDIGNTLTKVSVIETKTLKLKKTIYLKSNKVESFKYLNSNFNKILSNKKINKYALFSSVVPKYYLKFNGI